MIDSRSELCPLQEGIQLQLMCAFLVLQPREKRLTYTSYIGQALRCIVLGGKRLSLNAPFSGLLISACVVSCSRVFVTELTELTVRVETALTGTILSMTVLARMVTA